jgi:hypothetical protein
VLRQPLRQRRQFGLKLLVVTQGGIADTRAQRGFGL